MFVVGSFVPLWDLVLLLCGDGGCINPLTICTILFGGCSFGGDITVDWNGMFHPGDNLSSSAMNKCRFGDCIESLLLSLDLLKLVSRPLGGLCPKFGVVTILSMFGSSILPKNVRDYFVYCGSFKSLSEVLYCHALILPGIAGLGSFSFLLCNFVLWI